MTSTSLKKQVLPFDHQHVLCDYEEATVDTIDRAIQGALAAKPQWEAMPLSERCAIFFKAADLLSTKYRYDMMAATMLGQGKTIWQAEIDSVAELADFWRFNCYYAQEIYGQQPSIHSPGVWNRVEYRPLEGFVYAVTPFNFTAIGGNLPSAPAIMGNVVLWKPSATAIYSNYLVFQILKEAGLPAGVVQFVPGPAAAITEKILAHRDFGGLHFTGSTQVFKDLWRQTAHNLDVYKSYPRIVGETGGKNFHFVHVSANVENVVHQTIRSAYEYQGQKCSACSRMYVPESLWPDIQKGLVQAVHSIHMGPVDGNRPAYCRFFVFYERRY